MRPDSLPRLWRYINLLLTYLLIIFYEIDDISWKYENIKIFKMCGLKLCWICPYWCQTLDKGGSVRALFVDFSKAFDRIDHNVQ